MENTHWVIWIEGHGSLLNSTLASNKSRLRKVIEICSQLPYVTYGNTHDKCHAGRSVIPLRFHQKMWHPDTWWTSTLRRDPLWFHLSSLPPAESRSDADAGISSTHKLGIKNEEELLLIEVGTRPRHGTSCISFPECLDHMSTAAEEDTAGRLWRNHFGRICANGTPVLAAPLQKVSLMLVSLSTFSSLSSVDSTKTCVFSLYVPCVCPLTLFNLHHS